MKFEHLRIGDTINTIKGFEHIIGYNGDIYYTQSFIINEKEESIIDGERKLTKQELEELAKEYDGKNHNFIWAEIIDRYKGA